MVLPNTFEKPRFAGAVFALVPALLAVLLIHTGAMAQTAVPQTAVPQTPPPQAAIPVQAAVPITAIEVTGTRRIDADTVRAYSGLTPGDSADARSLNEAVRRLFVTNLFEDVGIAQEGGVVTITVLENPIINRIAFEGNKVVKDDHILQFMTTRTKLQPRRVFTQKDAIEGKELITEIYRQSGRYAAVVEPKIIELPDRRVDLVFEIDEGPLVKISSIRFIGNEAFSDRALRGVIESREAKWYIFLTQNDKYDPGRLANDERALRQFYLQNGYADMEVLHASGELLPDRSGFTITFRMREGIPYTVRDVTVTSQLEGVNTAEVLAAGNLKTGEEYDVRILEETLTRMTDKLGEFGYAFVDLTPDIQPDRDTGMLDIAINIGAAQKNHVEAININGNHRTLDHVIRRQFELVEGDSFNQRKLAQSERNVRNLGYFVTSGPDAVKVDVQPGSSPDQSVVEMTVAEQSTGSLALSVGYSTYEKALLGFGITERNFLGTGRAVNANVRASSRSTDFDVGIVEPYLFDRDLRGSFGLFSRETEYTGVDVEKKGFNLGIGFSAANDFSHRVGYSLSENTTTTRSTSAASVTGDEGSILVSEISYTLRRDTRDSFIDPRRGYYWQISESLAGLGGDAKYISSVFSGQYLKSFYFNTFVFGVNVEAGNIRGLDGEKVTRSNRFSLGGRRLRGFDFDGIGPRDTGNNSTVGGNNFYRGSLNLVSDLGMPEDLGMRWTVFADAGTVWGTDFPKGVRDPDWRGLRSSFGWGILWDTAIGPMSFTWARPIRRENYDDTRVFQFSFGGSF